MEHKTLTVAFGAMSPKLSKQLRDQKFKFQKKDIVFYERKIDAFLLLRMNGYLTDKMSERVRNKIYKSIEKYVIKQNSLTK